MNQWRLQWTNVREKISVSDENSDGIKKNQRKLLTSPSNIPSKWKKQRKEASLQVKNEREDVIWPWCVVRSSRWTGRIASLEQTQGAMKNLDLPSFPPYGSSFFQISPAGSLLAALFFFLISFPQSAVNEPPISIQPLSVFSSKLPDTQTPAVFSLSVVRRSLSLVFFPFFQIWSRHSIPPLGCSYFLFFYMKPQGS